MFRSISLSLCMFFLAQTALANFSTRTEQCISDLKAGSQALIKAAQTVDNSYLASGYDGFNFFTKMIKDGNSQKDRKGKRINHMDAAERYMKRRGQTMQTLANLNRIHGTVSAAIPRARRAMRSCSYSKSCNGMKSSKQHIKNLKIKCRQLNDVRKAFEQFAATKALRDLSGAQAAVQTMQGTNRNMLMISRAQKAEGEKQPLLAENDSADDSNGEVTEPDNNQVFSEPEPKVQSPLAQDEDQVLGPPETQTRKKKSRNVGSLEAVQNCQDRFRNNFTRFKFCGCRISDSYRVRKSCQRGVARQSDAELCENNNTIRRNFRRKCRRISFSSGLPGYFN